MLQRALSDPIRLLLTRGVYRSPGCGGRPSMPCAAARPGCSGPTSTRSLQQG